MRGLVRGMCLCVFGDVDVAFWLFGRGEGARERGGGGDEAACRAVGEVCGRGYGGPAAGVAGVVRRRLRVLGGSPAAARRASSA